MKISEKYYSEHMNYIEPQYMTLAEELTQQLMDCMDWKHNTIEIDTQKVIALWLKVNKPHCKEK